jgi:uncharacterized protein YdaU (DUF1376 family)
LSTNQFNPILASASYPHVKVGFFILTNMNWFKHDYSAAEDDKILELRAEYGWEGYGIFFAILEYMCKTEKGIDRKRIGALRMVVGTVEGYLEGYLEHTLKVGLFYEENGIIWNQRIRDHIDQIQHRRVEGSKAGKKSGKARREKAQNEVKSKVTFAEPSRNPSTDKIRVDKIREDKREIYPLPKSSNDPELIRFFKSNGSNEKEASLFYNHYNSQGWVKSNNLAITDWYSIAINWIQKSIHNPTFNNTKFKKEIDPDEEARRLYGVKL